MRRYNAKGFTLIEILISLLLISLTFGLISSSVSSSRDRLDSARQQIERSIVFSIDEATIRNSLIRIHFLFDGQQQKISVEAGDAGNYTLPLFLFADNSNLTKEELKKKRSQLKNRFNMLRDFQDSQYSFDDDIRIVAIASSVSRQLITEGESAIYFYPTGEKDDALIFIGSEEELVVIKLSAFLLKMSVEYLPLELMSNENSADKQVEMAKEIFEKWLKNS